MLETEVILSPSGECRAMLLRRMSLRKSEDPDAFRWGGVLLVQGQVAQLMSAVDVATKAARVDAREVWGNCPQHITTVAFMGDAADVLQALQALKDRGLVR